MTDNLDNLWRAAIEHFKMGDNSDHGPQHWRRVEKNALELARQNGADVNFVRVFAILHDSCRENEFDDPEHGQRAADLAQRLRGSLFEMDDATFDRLQFALIWHDKGKKSEDIEIGTCWDADRLDLGRVDIPPLPSYMSTQHGRRLCLQRLGQMFPIRA